MKKGFVSLVFHSHLPYCRQAGVWPFGEEWVFEAMAETYVPLLALLCRLREEKVGVKVALGFTPVLLEQLQDPYMQTRFLEYLEARMEAARQDVVRFAAAEPKLAALAEGYLGFYGQVARDYGDLQRDLVGVLRRLQEEGVIELLAGAATHAYLPLLEVESSLQAQLAVGQEAYRHYFHTSPRGIWLPECGYRPGLERYLEALGIKYFLVDGHAIRGGYVDAVYHAPGPTKSTRVASKGRTTLQGYYVGQSQVAVLGRDQLTGLQVWSGDWGYPTDGAYREFHKRDQTSGFHYWRITSPLVDLEGKDIYDPDSAALRVKEQAEHFVQSIKDRFTGGVPAGSIILAPYDLELFGHWWREGISWLEGVFRGLAAAEEVQMTTPGEYLAAHPPTEAINLPECSWGQGGRHYIWMNPATEWMWPQVHEAARRLEKAAARGWSSPLARRVLAQAGREVLLMQSSDWPFLISTQKAEDYASRRFLEHLSRLERLLDGLEGQDESDSFLAFLAEVEERDKVFSFLDPKIFAAAAALSSGIGGA
jgi:1,4-alpha-glucan branching enzyme